MKRATNGYVFFSTLFLCLCVMPITFSVFGTQPYRHCIEPEYRFGFGCVINFYVLQRQLKPFMNLKPYAIIPNWIGTTHEAKCEEKKKMNDKMAVVVFLNLRFCLHVKCSKSINITLINILSPRRWNYIVIINSLNGWKWVKNWGTRSWQLETKCFQSDQTCCRKSFFLFFRFGHQMFFFFGKKILKFLSVHQTLSCSKFAFTSIFIK